jgi:hypothetical protein
MPGFVHQHLWAYILDIIEGWFRPIHVSAPYMHTRSSFYDEIFVSVILSRIAIPSSDV